MTAHQTLVLVDLEERKACPVPDGFRERIREFEGEDVELDGSLAGGGDRCREATRAAAARKPVL